MANKAGFTIQAVGGMIRHYTRTADESGKYQDYPRAEGGGHIVESETYNNYSIGECHSAEWVHDRLKDVYQRPQDRGRSPVMLDIVVTMPKDEPTANTKAFMGAAYDSLTRQFGKQDNIVGAWVHLDEAQPHLHFAFLPIVPKQMKSRPEVKEGISQSAYFPKKSALREMHEILQCDISEALGHRVAILNGATAGGNKTVSELKARTAKQIERARTQFLDLKELRDNIEAGKTFPIFGDTIYKADAETINGILKYAAAGATACRIQNDLEARTRNAEAKAVQADKEKAEITRELAWTQEALAKLQQETKPYADIPQHFKRWAADKIESWRQSHRNNTDQVNRTICKMFLDNGRDFRQTVEQAAPMLNKMHIPPKEHKAYIKACLSAVMKQARAVSRAEKKGGGWTPPARGSGWQPKPSETNFFKYLMPDLSNIGMPITANQFSHKDWDDLDDEEKERILFLMQM